MNLNNEFITKAKTDFETNSNQLECNPFGVCILGCYLFDNPHVSVIILRIYAFSRMSCLIVCFVVNALSFNRDSKPQPGSLHIVLCPLKTKLTLVNRSWIQYTKKR